jgi:hypothetical protein
LPKNIPISIFGGFLLPDVYSWRAETGRAISEQFPTLIYPHPGYYKPTPRHKFAVTGEAYARLLNRSYFSLADTTRFDYLVRKHLEIPASGSVLIAPDSPALKPYGFRDMENCILGSGQGLFKKIAVVADNPTLYEKIRRAGYDLVHSKYTRQDWRRLLDFFACLRTLKEDETIEQKTIFGGFEKVPLSTPPQAVICETYPDNEIALMSNLWLESLFKKADLSLITEKMTEKANLFSSMSEYWVPIGIGALLKGQIAYAQECFLKPQASRLKNTGFAEFDPEEIAWLSLTASLIGKRDLLDLVSQQAPLMRHLSLRRMNWLGQVMAGKLDPLNPETKILYRHIDDHLSIHFTGQSSLSEWLILIDRILKANGQESELSKQPLGVSPE